MIRVRTRMISVFLLCAALMLIVSACGKKTDVREGDSFIYFLNGDRTGLQKVKYEISEKDPLEAAQAVLKELAKPSEDIEYTPPLRKGIEVQDCAVVGEVVYLNFNQEYEKLSALEETLVRAAVVQSLVRINSINGVWIKVDGADLKDSEGKVLGYLNNDDFVQNNGTSLGAYQTAVLNLYFADETGDYLVEEQVDVRYSSNVSIEKLIVDHVLKGPAGKNVYPTVNPDTTLLSVTTKDGICYINFDSTFLKSVYDVKPEVTVYSIVDSIIEGTDASMVQISINGETNTTYMETVDLTSPLTEDLSLVKTEDGQANTPQQTAP